MGNIISAYNNIITATIIDIIVAICIIIFFKIFSSNIAYLIIRMFKFRIKNKKEIKENAFYNPLRIFLVIFGFYLGIIFLQERLGLFLEQKIFITKAFQIISVLAISRGLAISFMPKSSWVKKKKESLGKESANKTLDIILKGIRIVIYVIAGFIAINILGINLNGLAAGLGIGSLVITLAAQDTAKNLFGGIVIFLDKPFGVGDWIQMDTFEGTIEDITFRSTRIRTFENSIVNIPNSIITNTPIINWSRMEKRRYKINLCVELDTPIEKLQKFQVKVKEMLQQRDAIFDDSIIVKFDEIKDNGINILVCSYTDSVDYPSYLAEKESINYKIMKILKEENIELAYDTKTICMK